MEDARGGPMVSVVDSGSSGPGLSAGRGHCVVFLGKTLYSHGYGHIARAT